MRKNEHKHEWSMGYVPGDAYRYCRGCSHVEAVSPEGKPSKASAALVALVKRNHGLK